MLQTIYGLQFFYIEFMNFSLKPTGKYTNLVYWYE